MLKAICTIQNTMLESRLPYFIADKEDFFDDKFEYRSSLGKEKRDAILRLEVKKILWELQIPPEYFLTLFQNKLDKDSFKIEKQPYRKENSC